MGLPPPGSFSIPHGPLATQRGPIGAYSPVQLPLGPGLPFLRPQETLGHRRRGATGDDALPPLMELCSANSES